jgi:acyl-CoA synthetase (AMP-forming)/AMP-acid ligase II
MKTNIAHTEQQEFPEETLWKFMERGILSDNNRHDALIYFGRRVSRRTLVEQVRLWARVIKGIGLKEGDELLLFGPSLPEFIYIMLAADMTGVTANLPNLMASPEALDSMAGRSRVAFVFDGMEQMIRHTLQREQFEHVVILSATRSMGYPLKMIASPLNSLTHFCSRHRAKYITADAAIRRFGHYEGPLETTPEKGKAAFIFCSSGTSNKGVANQIGMSDEAMIAMFRNALAFNENGNPFCEGTTSYCQLPPFVCTGFFVLVLAPLFRGMTVYLDPRPDVKQFTKNILAFRPQIVLTPGGNWIHFIQHIDRLIERGQRPDLSFFRFPVMGGEGCTPQALRHMNEVLQACGSPVALTSGYGLSETFSVCTVDYEPTGFDKDYSRPVVSVGPPFPGVTIGIFDEHGKQLGPDQRGEIRVKTNALTMGYINNPELTKERLQDGWLHTHDLGELDKDDKLFVYGRMAQYVEAENGEKVYLFDIANKLREDPAVKEALVCQLIAENQPLVANIVLEDHIPQTEQEIRRRLESMMASYLPAGLHIDDYRFEHGHLRINIVGKIDRHSYRQL